METLRRAIRKVVTEGDLQKLVIESGKKKIEIHLLNRNGSIGFYEKLPGGETRWISVDTATGTSQAT